MRLISRAARGPYYGATPPPYPQNGDEWVFPADATNGVMWRFRFNANSASAYQWEFVGGGPLRANYTSSVGLGTGTNTLASLTVPRAGDYEGVVFSSIYNISGAPGGSDYARISMALNGSEGSPEAWVAPPVASMGSGGIVNARTCVSGDSLQLCAFLSAGVAKNWQAYHGSLAIRPIRVS